jgi:hypothetical protein
MFEIGFIHFYTSYIYSLFGELCTNSNIPVRLTFCQVPTGSVGNLFAEKRLRQLARQHRSEAAILNEIEQII